MARDNRGAPPPAGQGQAGGPPRPTIVFVAQPMTTLRPANDSVTLVTTELARRLTDRARVVLCGSGGSRRTRSEVIDGMEHVFVPVGPDLALHRIAIRVHRALRRGPRRPFFDSSLSYLPYAVRVALQARRRRADVVHVQSFSHIVPVIRLLHPRARIVLHMHCDWLSQLDATMIGRRLRKVDLVVGCSDHVTGLVRAAFPAMADRCVTVANGVSTGWAEPRPPAEPQGPRRLLFVGRVSPEKGVHVLVEAFREVAAARPDVQLDIVGPESTLPAGFIVDISADPRVGALRRFYGAERYGDRVRRLIDEGIAERVRFVGFVPADQLGAWYARADVLVNPSLSESYGVPLVEAMAAGVPVVASRIGGIPEVVDDGETGLLVEPGDPHALAAAILAVLDDAGLADRLRAAGRRAAAGRFTWDQRADALWAAYRRVLAGPRGGPVAGRWGGPAQGGASTAATAAAGGVLHRRRA